MENNDIPPTPPPAADTPEFPVWLCRRLGQKLKAARLAKDLSVLALSRQPGSQLSNEAVGNNEKGEKNAGLATYARHGQLLKLNILDLLDELREEQRRSP